MSKSDGRWRMKRRGFIRCKERSDRGKDLHTSGGKDMGEEPRTDEDYKVKIQTHQKKKKGTLGGNKQSKKNESER